MPKSLDNAHLDRDGAHAATGLDAGSTGKREFPRPSTAQTPAVLLYDVLESGCAAKRFLDRLIILSEGELQFHLRLWRFDILAAWAPLTSDYDTGSGMLVVALQPGQVIPPHVSRWLETWAQAHEQGGEDALLVLLQQARTARDTAALQNAEQLRNLAIQHGFSFLADNGPEVTPPAASFATKLRARERCVSPTMQGILRRRPWTGGPGNGCSHGRAL